MLTNFPSLTMKKTGIVLSLFLTSIFTLSCLPTSLNRGDILLAQRDYRDARNFTIPDKTPVIGTSTEEDIYSIYGADVDRRLTYKTTRQKTINGKVFSYNKIIQYEDYLYEFSNKKEGDYTVNSASPSERSEVVIYLLEGKVIFFAARHQSKIGEDFTTDQPAINLDAKGEVWPNKVQDIKEYREQ